MAFFKIRWPGQDAQDEKPAQRSRAGAAESVEAMRRRARHRLIGAAVLVLLGVIGFPLLFDTQPRPVAVDIPIEIPDRNKAAPLVVPAPASPQAAPAGASQPAAAPKEAAPEKAVGAHSVPARAGLGRGEELVDAPVAKPAEKSSALLLPSVKPQAGGRTEGPAVPGKKTEAKPASGHEATPEAKPGAAAAPQRKSEPDEAARVRALLEGGGGSSLAKTSAATGPTDAARFIVQVGAFADADKAREVRAKLERAGLKTYTQVLDTKDGKRTRVRVGPFASKTEADKAAARIHGIGLSASVLGL